MVAWYENDGSQGFTERVISTDIAGPRKVIVADLDGDGDTDVIVSAYDLSTAFWFDNDGSQNFTERTITTSTEPNALGLFAVDLDTDGDLDVIVGSYGADRFSWYENTLTTDFPEFIFEDGFEDQD